MLLAMYIPYSSQQLYSRIHDRHSICLRIKFIAMHIKQTIVLQANSMVDILHDVWPLPWGFIKLLKEP